MLRDLFELAGAVTAIIVALRTAQASLLILAAASLFALLV